MSETLRVKIIEEGDARRNEVRNSLTNAMMVRKLSNKRILRKNKKKKDKKGRKIQISMSQMQEDRTQSGGL